IVTHFAVPSLQAKDGSKVVAARIAGVPGATGAIPWLKLGATSATAGPDGARLAGTTFIQRINTAGGVAPSANDCNAGTYGTVQEVPYTADYVFWKKPGSCPPPGSSMPAPSGAPASMHPVTASPRAR